MVTWWLFGLAGIAAASFMLTIKAESAPQAAVVCDAEVLKFEAVDHELEDAFAETSADAIKMQDQEHVHRGGGVAGNIHASVEGSVEMPGVLPTVDPAPQAQQELTPA